MGLFDGLSRFGMKGDINEEVGNTLFMTAREKEQLKMKGAKTDELIDDGLTEEERRIQIEKSHLIKRNISCKCCDKIFPTLTPRGSRIRRMEPDKDLRPRCKDFDTLKYNVYHCPYCGYTSIARIFPSLSTRARKAVEQKICSQFKPEKPMDDKEFFTYDEAIDWHKLALFTEVIKDGKASDKAYICLLLGWLYRGKKEELELQEKADAKEIQKCRDSEMECLEQAFEGFNKAFSVEMAPYAGMDELTAEYLLASLAVELGKYDAAARSVSHIIISRTASNRIKDKARMLKEEILEKVHT